MALDRGAIRYTRSGVARTGSENSEHNGGNKGAIHGNALDGLIVLHGASDQIFDRSQWPAFRVPLC